MDAPPTLVRMEDSVLIRPQAPDSFAIVHPGGEEMRVKRIHPMGAVANLVGMEGSALILPQALGFLAIVRPDGVVIPAK